MRKRGWGALVRSTFLSMLLLAGCRRDAATPVAPAGDTFAELRRVKGSVVITERGEAERAPYPRERLAEGAAVTLAEGGLAWIRRDGGAVWLVSGPARLVAHGENFQLDEGRAFVDTEGGPPVSITTPRGSVELSDARSSVDVHDGTVSVYVLSGGARAGKASRASAGELLTLRPDGSNEERGAVSWEDWTGGLATADPAAEAAPFGVGTVGARPPGDQGKPRFSLAVQRLDVRVTFDRDFAMTEVDETFVNPTSEVVEGMFGFRTPPGAVLNRFGVDRKGSLVWGRVQEKKSAAAQYQSNVYAGSAEDPALLEWVLPGVYAARLYPIDAGSPRRVVTRYTEWLPRGGAKGDRRLYVYPMAAEGARGTLPRIEELTVTLDLGHAGAKRVRAGMGGKRDGDHVVIKAFDFVPRADLAVELFDDGQQNPVLYRARHALSTEDAPEHAEAGFAEKVSAEEPDYLLVPLRTRAPAEMPPGLDLAIVVDTSAATEAPALAVARSLAAALITHLGPADRAAMWAGDASLRPVFEGSGTLTTLDVGKRRAWLGGLSAIERGGATDIGALLTEAASRLDPKRRGAVLYIGDGLPSVGEVAPKALQDRLARLPQGTRLFAAALGSAANVPLLQSIVRGAPVERVSDAYGAARAALRFLESADRSVWLGATLDLGPGIDRILPRVLPPVGADESVLVVGRVAGAAPTELTLRGSGGTITEHIAVTPLLDSGDLRKRWGGERLAELAAEGANRAALVDIGRRYGLVSPFTSLYVPTEAETAASAHQQKEAEEDPVRLREEGHERRGRWKPWTAFGSAFAYREPVHEVAAVAEVAEDNKEGGTGTRAKAEEGAMGAPKKKSATGDRLYMEATAGDVDAKQRLTGNRDVGGPRRDIEAPAPKAAPRAAMEAAKGIEIDSLPVDPDVSAAAAPEPKAPTGRSIDRLGITATDVSPAIRPGASSGGVGASAGSAIRPGASGGGLGALSGLSALGAASGSAQAVTGPHGTVTVGTAIVTGGTVSNAVRVVAGMRAGFRNCFNRQLVVDPETAGSLDLAVHLGPGGEVQTVAATPMGHLASPLVACVKARAQNAQFEPPRGTATITVSLTFASGNVTEPATPLAPEPKPPEPVPMGPPRARVARPLALIEHTPRPCGAAADLPVEERKILWSERLSTAQTPEAVADVYFVALAACEAPTFHERYSLLLAMVDRLTAVRERVALWRALSRSANAAEVVYRATLVRVQTAAELRELHEALGIAQLDPSVLATLLEKAKIPKERLAILRSTFQRYPDDLELALLVLDAYEDAGDDAGGRAFARRIRRRPDATAHVHTSVGEYYLRLGSRGAGPARARDENEARRSFGEIVEFSPDDPVARRRLGDLLRAHGWYAEAFRQYETLARLTPDDPGVPLLLASAAQGMGRIEEAVRWAEKAAASGSPDGASALARSAEATASAFLAWARQASAEAGKKDEVERLIARARRLASSEAAGPGAARFIVTWAHPELRPSLWTNALGSLMPAPDDFPLFGVAEARLSTTPAPVIELRLDPDDAARAARLGAEVVVTAIVAEGTPEERILRQSVGFRGKDGAPRSRVTIALDGASLRVGEP